ncbi:MAG TPA: hypothetical protein VM511_05435 [Luteolibacter sp.]|nr:hypothetical protein [Luteolibacter sp.]
MSNHLKKLTTALQKDHLKTIGFEKRYETFSRSHPKFSEHFHLSSSPLNRAGEPWKYELTIGVGFHDIPSKQKGQLAGTHISHRVATIETTLGGSDETDPAILRNETTRLASIVQERSEHLRNHYDTLRQSYDRGAVDPGFLMISGIDESDK